MEAVVSTFGLDSDAFSQWVSAEKRRLPGCTDGFARFLAFVRMTRPAHVVWVSDGQEPQTCGYEPTTVARLLVDMLGYGSQLLWFRVGDENAQLSYLNGLGGADAVVTPFSVVCVPDGYDVQFHQPGLRLRGAHAIRSAVEWRFLRWEPIDISGGSDVVAEVDSVGGELVSESVDESSDESVSESMESSGEMGGQDEKPKSRRRARQVHRD